MFRCSLSSFLACSLRRDIVTCSKQVRHFALYGVPYLTRVREQGIDITMCSLCGLGKPVFFPLFKFSLMADKRFLQSFTTNLVILWFLTQLFVLWSLSKRALGDFKLAFPLLCLSYTGLFLWLRFVFKIYWFVCVPFNQISQCLLEASMFKELINACIT